MKPVQLLKVGTSGKYNVIKQSPKKFISTTLEKYPLSLVLTTRNGFSLNLWNLIDRVNLNEIDYNVIDKHNKPLHSSLLSLYPQLQIPYKNVILLSLSEKSLFEDTAPIDFIKKNEQSFIINGCLLNSNIYNSIKETKSSSSHLRTNIYNLASLGITKLHNTKNSPMLLLTNQ